MKHILLTFLLFIVAFSVIAQQRQARQFPGKVKYGKTELDATIIDLPYAAGDVEDGLKEFLARNNVQVKSRNGFFEGRGVRIDSFDIKMFDVYYKVDKSSKSGSWLYIILTEPNEDPAARHTQHAEMAALKGGTSILSAIPAALDDYDFNLNVRRQEEEIRKMEKRMITLSDSQSKLEKRKAELEAELEKTKKEQEELKKESANKKTALEQFIQLSGRPVWKKP
jgi:hypothetical protein